LDWISKNGPMSNSVISSKDRNDRYIQRKRKRKTSLRYYTGKILNFIVFELRSFNTYNLTLFENANAD